MNIQSHPRAYEAYTLAELHQIAHGPRAAAASIAESLAESGATIEAEAYGCRGNQFEVKISGRWFVVTVEVAK